MAQGTWETAMGMRGYAGSAAEREDRNDLSLKIENVIGGFRNYGYVVVSRPIPGEEANYYAHLLAGLKKVERTIEDLHENAHCRGKSKRTLALLHSSLPEPCWGVGL